MVNREKILMGRATYDTLPRPLQTNLDRLIGAINGLIIDLKILKPSLKPVLDNVQVSSGYRPPEVNAKVGAKNSYHLTCLACDILDDSAQSLAKAILEHPDLLKKHQLWLENPQFTKGKHTNWVHLDLGTRSERDVHMFNP